MIDLPLSPEERKTLLRLARRSIELAIKGVSLPRLMLSDFSAPLREQGASFVTLTERGELRGCIGALEAYQPLVQDVCEHAVAAATEDYRFSPVQPFELPRLKIEISRLTPPTPLKYTAPEELLTLLQPNIDGVVLKDMGRRATFLPQVWEKIPEPGTFLNHLCQKMGAPSDLWRTKPIQVFTYQVEEFAEE
jgi:AmmeMemoRadiSam system protein A